LPNPYDKIAARFAQARKPWLEQRYLPGVIDGLAPGDRVLDLGCGAGRPIAERLAAAGLRVVGVDSSIELLRLARRNGPAALLLLARLLALEKSGRGDIRRRHYLLARRRRGESCNLQSAHSCGVTPAWHSLRLPRRSRRVGPLARRRQPSTRS